MKKEEEEDDDEKQIIHSTTVATARIDARNIYDDDWKRAWTKLIFMRMKWDFLLHYTALY